MRRSSNYAMCVLRVLLPALCQTESARRVAVGRDSELGAKAVKGRLSLAFNREANARRHVRP
jgi:hypothetical protein